MKTGKLTFAFLLIGIVFSVYIATMSQTVNLIDSGELALAAKNLGIAHPTGYPLYTLLARVFIAIFPVPSVFATNFMSLLFGVLSVLVFFLIFFDEEKSLYEKIFILLGSLALGFSKTLWSISTETEVYSLEVFLDLAIILAFYKALFIAEKHSTVEKHLLFGFFILGLGFTNHMHTILYFPAILILGIIQRKRIDLSVGKILIGVLLFILGISVYCYLPIRASFAVEPNWGDPIKFQNFLRHISGWQYQTWMFSSGESLSGNVRNFIKLYFDQSFYFMPVLTLLSVLLMIFNKKWKQLVFWLMVIIVDFIYAINYTIPDIDAYFLPLFLASIALIIEAYRSIDRKWLKHALFFMILVMCLVSAGFNYASNDKSDDYFAEKVGFTTLLSANPNSMILLENWDFFAPARYLQKEYHFREDIVLVDFGLLKRSWYIKELRTHYPEYFNSSATEMDEFLEQVRPFEEGEKYDGNKIEKAYRAMIFSFVGKNIQRGVDVYGFVQWQPLNQKFRPIPEGFLIRYTNLFIDERVTYPSFYYWDELPVWGDVKSPRRKTILSIFESSLLARAGYLSRFERYSEAIPFMKRLLEMFPDNKKYIENHAVLHVKAGKYKEAIDAFRLMEPFADKNHMNIIYKDLNKKIQARRDSVAGFY